VRARRIESQPSPCRRHSLVWTGRGRVVDQYAGRLTHLSETVDATLSVIARKQRMRKCRAHDISSAIWSI